MCLYSLLSDSLGVLSSFLYQQLYENMRKNTSGPVKLCINKKAIPEFKINSNTAHETSNIVSF